jgi:hypothetical protein
MTAILNFQMEGQPIIFSDLLLSTSEHGPAPLLPTAVNPFATIPAESPFRPAGMGQKIAVIHPDLIVSYTGRQSVAEDVVRDLKQKYEHVAPAANELEDYLGALPFSPAELGMLAMLSVEPTRIYHAGLNAASFEDPRFGVVRHAGSGQGEVAQLLRSVESISENEGRKLNPYAKAIGCALTMSGHLIGREIVVGDTLSKYFGGGYDIATRINNSWKKLQDILTIVWAARETLGAVEIAPIPIRLIRQAHEGDMIVIRSLINEPPAPLEERTIIVPAVDREPSASETAVISPPQFAAHWIVHQFVVQRLDGRVTPRSRVTFNQDRKNADIRISWTGRKLDIMYRSDYFEQLKEFARPP